MPTANPRLQITLEPETYSVLKRLAAVQRRPAAAIVREVLHGCTEMLGEVASSMEAIEAAQGALRDRLGKEAVAGLSEAHEALEPLVSGIMGHITAISDLVTEIAEAGEDADEKADAGSAPQRSEERKPAAVFRPH
jgi:predicted DNA-binding protein